MKEIFMNTLASSPERTLLPGKRYLVPRDVPEAMADQLVAGGYAKVSADMQVPSAKLQEASDDSEAPLGAESVEAAPPVDVAENVEEELPSAESQEAAPVAARKDPLPVNKRRKRG